MFLFHKTILPSVFWSTGMTFVIMILAFLIEMYPFVNNTQKLILAFKNSL